MKYFILAGFLILCYIGYEGYRAVRNRFIMDPSAVETVAKSIMDYRLPAKSAGILAMDLGLHKMAVVECPSANVILVLAALTDFSKPASELEAQVEDFKRTILRLFTRPTGMEGLEFRWLKRLLSCRWAEIAFDDYSKRCSA